MSPEEKSTALRVASPASLDPRDGVLSTPVGVRQRAFEVIERVPLPNARNSARSLIWEHQGPFTEGDVQSLVQTNAMCDWLEHAIQETASSGGVTPATRAVVAHLPHWSMIRGKPFGSELMKAVSAWQAGDAAPLSRFLRFCKRPDKQSRSAWEMYTD